jgi:hypothetical protein
MDDISLVRGKATQLLEQVRNAGYTDTSDVDEHVHTVVSVLKTCTRAETPEQIPKQVGGDYFFMAMAVESEYGLDGFATEFRKIHEALGRDAALERKLIEGEEEFAEKHGSNLAKRLDNL